MIGENGTGLEYTHRDTHAFKTQCLFLIVHLYLSFFFTWKPKIQLSLERSIGFSWPRCSLCCSPATRHSRHLPEWRPSCCWAGWKSSLWLMRANRAAKTQWVSGLREKIISKPYTLVLHSQINTKTEIGFQTTRIKYICLIELNTWILIMVLKWHNISDCAF